MHLVSFCPVLIFAYYCCIVLHKYDDDDDNIAITIPKSLLTWSNSWLNKNRVYVMTLPNLDSKSKCEYTFSFLFRLCCIGLSRYIAITQLSIIAVFLEYLRQLLIDLHQIYRHSSVPINTSP